MTRPRLALRSRYFFMILSVLCLAPFVMGALVAVESESEDSLFKQLSVLSEVLTLIQRTYVDETSISALLEGALEGATDALDPMATFVPADHKETYAETLRVGSSRSGVVVAKDRGVAYAVAVAEGSPAATAGIQHGDVISAIDGVSARNMALWRLQSLLAGTAGTELELELLRGGQSRTAELLLGPFEGPRPTIRRHDEIAVLRLPRFASEDVGIVRDLIADTVGDDDRLIVDLRGTAGGEAEAAFEIAALFASGKLGSMRSRDAELRTYDSDLPPLWQGSVAVVMDGGTQGPAEILAAILKQSTEATLVGQPTFGLAGRRGLIDLPNGSLVVMTDALYAGPDGEPIDERLRPDELVRATLRSLADEDVSLDDLMLERAVEVLARAGEKAA
ncbi:MAG: S41 family peptidase [Acidobacteria bacterium]|nr:S41 family peptidase [Acidobacteriota bacterium]